VVAACLNAAAQLELREVIAWAKALAGDAEVSAAVRTAALATLATLREPTWTDVLPQVLASADHDLVLATLALLERQAGAAGTAEQLARFVQPGVERRLAQAALRVLPLLPHSDALLGRAHEVLRAQHELALDVRAALQRRDAPFAQALLASWPAHDDELFAGGDPARGRELFRHRADLQCLRCHAVGDEGGPVGPALDRIGHKPPAELLQALREPSAVIAEGWPQGAPSAMPSGLDALLSPLELRDLLAYLRSLR
jgi:quinoprotein glucose dehydrogenase